MLSPTFLKKKGMNAFKNLLSPYPLEKQPNLMSPSSKSQSLPSPVSFSLLMKKSAKSLTQISHSHLLTNTWPKLQQRIPIISQLLNATRLDTYFLHYLTSLLHGTFLPISSLRSKWTFMLVVPVGCPCSSYFKMFNYLIKSTGLNLFSTSDC